MKKVIKLDRNALRSLITEAINAREPGSPLWAPEPQSVDEADKSKPQSADAVVSEVGQALGDYFRSQYNDGDPIQSEYGQEAWNAQVDIAVDEIVSLLIEKIEEVETRLHNGEFAEHDF